MRGIVASMRYWLPLDAGLMTVLATLFVGPVLTWIMLMVGFALILDGATAMWERAGGVGNLSTHKQ